MGRNILLSVIVPFLNASEDVEGLFQAIKAQTGVDKKTVEVIIINDGSTDDTQQKIEKLRPMFDDFADYRILVHKKRMGLAQTRYDGAQAAKGQFLTFVDKRTRPDQDYFASLLGKKYNIVIGNIYMNKTASPWDRLAVLIRKKLYFPYFNHPFDDMELTQETYKKFKNKGGGGVMLVRREYYLQVAKDFKKGKDINDDSMLIQRLLAIEPLLKTADARARYLNRTGFKENVKHTYGRGPKFVDYYTKPGTRFFPFVVALCSLLLANLLLILLAPVWIMYEFIVALTVLLLLSVYLAEDFLDFITCFWLLPIILVVFVVGIIKGLAMKVLRMY